MKTEPPDWVVEADQFEDPDYRELWERRDRAKGKLVELYFADHVDPEQPFVFFQHIRKTAGTSLRHLIYSNKGETSFEMLRLPGKRGREAGESHAELYRSLDRPLVFAAGHTANFFAPLVEDRPVLGLTLLRRPIDHVVSTHYFLRRDEHTTLEDLYGVSGSGPAMKSTASNWQARSLLAPHYDTRSIPLLATDPDGDLWRGRLFDLVDRLYLVGLQDRFLHSVSLFAERLGWTKLYPASVRFSARRPREPVEPKLADAIRRYNWLDESLYERTRERFDREGPQWDEPEWG
jgi:hypothetical protein